MNTPAMSALLVVWITTLAAVLDARQQVRFVRLCDGLLFARGRRTVTSWLRACAVGDDYKRYYYLLGSVGRKGGDRRRPGPHPHGSAPARSQGRTAGLRHRRLAHQAVWAQGGGGRPASQPHPGAGRVPVPLRPRLGLPGPAGPPSAVGDDRLAHP